MTVKESLVKEKSDEPLFLMATASTHLRAVRLTFLSSKESPEDSALGLEASKRAGAGARSP